MDSKTNERLNAIRASMEAEASEVKDALIAASLATLTAERITEAHKGEFAAEARKYRESLISGVETHWERWRQAKYAAEQVAGVDWLLSTHMKEALAIPGLLDAVLDERSAWQKVIELTKE